MWRAGAWFRAMVLVCLAGCGGGSGDTGSGSAPSDPSGTAAWAAVSAAIDAAAGDFPGGLSVEIATRAGVVYSRSAGGFSPGTDVPVASASKWVTSTVLMRLVEQGALALDEPLSATLRDRSGRPWQGALGRATLRNLLSFTTGISGDVPASEDLAITLAEAVLRIHDDQAANATPPGSRFMYGSTHMRIAARLAELKTGKSWAQLHDEQLRLPLGWSAQSIYSGGGTNPNPAGGLRANGLEYMRFMALQLRQGLHGTQRLLAASSIAAQRADAFETTTLIGQSPYAAAAYHYGLGQWRECATPQLPAACDAALRVSSTGAFGWAPWIDVQADYAAVIMTRQPGQGTIIPSETLKRTLAGLVPAVVRTQPPVIRAVP